jgi:hypothetical protein
MPQDTTGMIAVKELDSRQVASSKANQYLFLANIPHLFDVKHKL